MTLTSQNKYVFAKRFVMSTSLVFHFSNIVKPSTATATPKDKLSESTEIAPMLGEPQPKKAQRFSEFVRRNNSTSHASKEDVIFLREVTPKGLEVILVRSIEENSTTQINR